MKYRIFKRILHCILTVSIIAGLLTLHGLSSPLFILIQIYIVAELFNFIFNKLLKYLEEKQGVCNQNISFNRNMVYLAGPYTHVDPIVRELRFQYFLKAEKYLLEHGDTVISPINMSHSFSLVYDLPIDYKFWQNRDRHFISICNEVVVLMMGGWETSVGVTDEIKYAKELGIPVRFISVEDIYKDDKKVKNT